MRNSWLLLCLPLSLTLVACSDDSGPAEGNSGGGSGGTTGGSGGRTGGAGGGAGSGGTGNFGGSSGLPPVGSLGSKECPALACLGCSSGSQCADTGPFVDGTCCAIGDNLVKLAEGTGSEVVDLEYDGRFVYLCGGFGVRINDLANPANPKFVSSEADRCQRIAIGPKLSDGSQVFYLAHHGDSWVPSPFLGTYHLSPSGSSKEVDKLEDAAVLFEGMAWAKGYLYNAVHGGGLRISQTDASGVPTLVKTLGGFTNAWKVDVQGNYAYVADAEAGVRVVDVSDPPNAQIVQTVPTLGPTRDIDADGDRVYVAMGGQGVDVFDASDPAKLTHIATINTNGSAQAVSSDGEVLAVAAWSHVALYDKKTRALIATERTRAKFEQDLGVAIDKDLVMVGEWEGLHVLSHRPGYVAPDLNITEEILTLPANQPAARAMVVANRGMLPLEVGNFAVDKPGYTFDVPSLSIAPSDKDFFQLSASNLQAGSNATLTLQSNDPDPLQALLSIPIDVGGAFGVGVGDKLTPEFGFLDPNGAGQLSGLQGKVIMLAYFALF